MHTVSSLALSPAVIVSLLSSGLFFMVGLLTGVWKYLAIMSSEKAEAPYYINIAHRASLMYSFASLMLAVFALLSVLPDNVNFWASVFPNVFFGAAIFTYVVHGVLRDTDNQLEKPHRLGPMTLPGFLISLFMWLLIAAEVGGSAVLVWGMTKGLLGL